MHAHVLPEAPLQFHLSRLLHPGRPGQPRRSRPVARCPRPHHRRHLLPVRLPPLTSPEHLNLCSCGRILQGPGVHDEDPDAAAPPLMRLSLCHRACSHCTRQSAKGTVLAHQAQLACTDAVAAARAASADAVRCAVHVFMRCMRTSMTKCACWRQRSCAAGTSGGTR